MTLLAQIWAVAIVAYLPGALVFRLPLADRSKRAALPAEERLFWAVLTSVLVSSVVVIALAAGGWYRFDRLLWTNGILCGAMLFVGPRRLRLEPAARRPTPTAFIPVALTLLAWWVNFAVPPAEYVMGGRDPGVYMNEGIQIAQRGGLAVTDPTVASVPSGFRDLFFPERGGDSYYSNRFMGFFLMDPSTGRVISQFSHLYPAWIAVGYGIHGLTGARAVVGFAAILGVLSLYFLGNRIAGRAAGAAGAALLTLNVLQVWYARYPNAEIVMQPLVFAGLLAYVRAHSDRDRFFAPVAALLFAISIFAHITAIFVLAAIVAAMVVGRFSDSRPSAWFVVPFLGGAVIGTLYLATFLSPYLATPLSYVQRLWLLQYLGLAAGTLMLFALLWSADVPAIRSRVRALAPPAFALVLCLLAVYAYFIREAGGRLPPHDADALRTFAAFYVTPLGLLAAFVGILILVRRSFWTSAPALIVFATFAVVFFYKIRIIPEHFWAGRRLITVILPGTLLFVGAAAFSSLPAGSLTRFARVKDRALQAARYAAGAVLVLVLGYQYVDATQPILRHVEYAGLIPKIETLAATVGEDDLVIVESRGASDAHVLALPLAYIYARNVLVLWDSDPDKALFREFLDWARTRYSRIFFVGGGGTDVLSREMRVQPVMGERFQVPEYESTWNTYPRATRFREFDFGVYEFLSEPAVAGEIDIDIGVADDVYVSGFHAKERRPNGTTFRWTRRESYVSIVGTRADCRRVVITMGSGGRPAAASPAAVEVLLDAVSLGEVAVGDGFAEFSFDVPPYVADRIAAAEDGARLRIVATTWNPKRILGANDDRDLGVMVDRVAVRCDGAAAP